MLTHIHQPRVLNSYRNSQQRIHFGAERDACDGMNNRQKSVQGHQDECVD